MSRDERLFLERVGFRIRERRTALKLTQAQLAALCGLHRTFIGAVERGERNVAILNLRKIATALRVPYRTLIAFLPNWPSNRLPPEFGKHAGEDWPRFLGDS